MVLSRYFLKKDKQTQAFHESQEAGRDFEVAWLLLGAGNDPMVFLSTCKNSLPSEPDQMELGQWTISPATPERNDPQCKFLPVTSECLTATKRTTGGQDTFQFPSGVQHFKPHASSSPMVCAVSRSNMFSLRKVGTPRAVVPEKEELLVW